MKQKRNPPSTAPAWLVRRMSVWRRPQPPALYEFYGCTKQEATDRQVELDKAVTALWKTTNTIAIFCGGGIAEVVDSGNPVSRVVCVVDHVRPRFGKVGMARAFREFVEQTELYEQRLCVRIIKKPSELIRRLCEWNHRTNRKISDWSQPPLTFGSYLSGPAGSRSLDRRFGPQALPV
jgi:hypothetical protein